MIALMWEEQPEYQKRNGVLVVLILAALFTYFIGYAIYNEDWGFLKNTLLLLGALIAFLSFLSGLGWLAVKFFTRNAKSRHVPDSNNPNRPH